MVCVVMSFLDVLIVLSCLNVYLLIGFVSETLIFKVSSVDSVDINRALRWPKFIHSLKSAKALSGFVVCVSVITLVISIVVYAIMKLGYESL